MRSLNLNPTFCIHIVLIIGVYILLTYHLSNKSEMNKVAVNDIYIVESESSDENEDQLSIPSLILIGPPKTGTTYIYSYLLPRLFEKVITFQNSVERFELGNEKCLDQDMIKYPQKWQFYPLNLSLYIDAAINNEIHSNTTKCIIFNYDHEWMKMNEAKHFLKWKIHSNKTCVPPQYYNKYSIKYNKCDFCITVEKNPHYAISPIVPILLTHFKPKTKILITIRNPIKQIWSFYFQEKSNHKQYDIMFTRNNYNYTKVIQQCQNEIMYLFEENYAFSNSSNLCNTFINDNNSDYQYFVSTYLEMHFNKKLYPQQVKRLIFAPLYFYQIITWIVAYNDININNDQINKYFKILQSDWFYKNIEKTMVLLNEWGLNDDAISNKNIKTKTNQLNNEYIHNKNKYNIGHTTEINMTNSFKQFLSTKYNKCNNALLKLLLNNHDLLMGEWIDW